ncbi:MAG: hypothetical protein MI919_12485 [Holophagales bacterium]|nr:hypothetical protein [Holophagales bacterium]
MFRRRIHLWVLALALPVWLVGMLQVRNHHEAQTRPAKDFRWQARYGTLKPLLEGVPTALLVNDGPRRGLSKTRSFRAQYVLMPTLLEYAFHLPEPGDPGSARFEGVPIVFDYRRDAELRSTLETLGEKAANAGWTLETVRLRSGLALAYLTRRQS